MQNRIAHSVRMDITDDETFGDNEPASVTRSGTFVLDTARPEQTDLTAGKCGGEVRVVTYRVSGEISSGAGTFPIPTSR
ncbi:hypothetical protein GCM10010840_13600 [Deinococcus aerolatus]|uniref:Uncharacterized protein n=1 Tax=Deinococcus aerolatus TaxID=522487 RepID=A0ABQ2G628_9DEIO|nr:hypothetical protein [Deinococcus aerolatus]GGL76848.1 hypothetical protein GCM10010840_13600 [Deinococcus aerolatus]